MTRVEPDDEYVPVASVSEMKENNPQIVRVAGKSIGLFYHEGEFYATDNRCPHMGFPLTEGTVAEGVLTCPWHHARFELSCGDTFDPFADDVRTYPVRVRGDEISVRPVAVGDTSPVDHWRDRLEHGLKENISLIIAKSVIGLDDEGIEYTVPVETGVTFGTQYRQDGWGQGLTTLGVMANLLPSLRSVDRRRALYVGLSEVADDCAGEPPFFVQQPLTTDSVSVRRLTAWFRTNIDVRDSDGAERVLRSAIAAGCTESELAGMLCAAATDHRFLDTGHQLDFINKAFETLDHIGWTYADSVLPSLVPGLASATRAEETSSWRQPVDIAELCFDAATDLVDLVDLGDGKQWTEPEDFVELLLGDDPHAIIDGLTTAIAEGATATELAEIVAYTAALRIVQFGTSNEFRDWNTVHHTYSYANAVYGISRRTDAPETYRSIFDAGMRVYLDRFLNVPAIPLPTVDSQRHPEAVLDELASSFVIESDEEVNRAGRLTAEYLTVGGEVDRLRQTLGEVLLREDANFHTRQNLEAAFNQHDVLSDEDRARVHLIATARYLSAHTPTRRAGEQTFQIADRLNRGEKIHEIG